MSGKKTHNVVAKIVGQSVAWVPGVGPLAQFFAEETTGFVLAEHARRSSIALAAAEKSAGMTREEISDTLIATPHLIPVVTRVLYEAGMNGDDEMLEVLGGILGDILLTPDDCEEAELILAGVAGLKRIHLQVLEKLNTPPKKRHKVEDSYTLVERYEAGISDNGELDLPSREPDEEGYVLQDDDAWNAEALALETGLSLTRTELALAGLTAAGFAHLQYRISPAGAVVLKAIEEWTFDK